MEEYSIIDQKKFNRFEYFHYFMQEDTIISFTSKLVVTTALQNCKDSNYSFAPYLIHKLYKTINTIENFKYDLMNGDLIKWKEVVPSFSSFNTKTQLFSTLYANINNDFEEYQCEYKKINTMYNNTNSIAVEEIIPSNIFNVSIIPWLHFEHFSSTSKTNKERIVKMFTIGKYEEVNNEFLIPITIQVSHAIVDGYHVSLLFNRLQTELNKK